MRAVLDANVLLSGFISKVGAPGLLLAAWPNGAFQHVISEVILAEAERTFEEPYFTQRLTAEGRAANLALLRRRGEIVPLVQLVSGVAPHPEDDLIPTTAVSGQADYLVTGDRALKRLGTFRGVTILSPREFLDRLSSTLAL